MVLVLTMVMSCFGSMSAIAATKTELVYNAPVVNDSYEDGTTPTFAWTKANTYSAIVSGTGHNKGSFVDPGSKYMNFFSNIVTENKLLDTNENINANSLSGLKAYMTGDINYISFDIASAWVTRDMVAFLDSNSTPKGGNLPALLFNAKGKYCAGTFKDLHPWYYTLTLQQPARLQRLPPGQGCAGVKGGPLGGLPDTAARRAHLPGRAGQRG